MTIGHLFMYNTTWFFFKSGMFHKPATLNYKTILKLVKKLIVPFLIFSLVGVTIQFLCHLISVGTADFRILGGIVGQIGVYGAPWWNIPVWFLLTLFFTKLITAPYNGDSFQTWLYLLTFAAISILHNIYSETTRFNYIGNTALAVFFYILGYKTKNIRFNSALTYCIAGGVFLAIFFLFPAALDIWSNKALYGNYFLAVLMAFLGILLVNKIFSLCGFLHIRPLIFMGQNAMLFLVLHVPFFLAFCELIMPLGWSRVAMNWWGGFISISCCLLICVLFDRNKKLKWIIGG